MGRKKSPDPLTVLTLRLRPLHRRELEERAKRQRKTVSAIVREMIEQQTHNGAGTIRQDETRAVAA